MMRACLFLLWSTLSATWTNQIIVTQTPGVVKMIASGTVTLKCHVDQILAFCHSVTWMKVDARTGTMSTRTNVKINTTSEVGKRDRVCSATITNALVSDSGMYYCLAVHSKAVHTGNGSNLIITESSTESPNIKIVSSDSDGSSAALLCLVSGVVPSQVHVFWLIDGREDSGLTESTWTDNSDSATEFTRNQILVQAEEWDRGVQCTCVVEFEGNSINKTLQRIDLGVLCYVTVWIYRLLGITAWLLLLILATTVAACRGKTRGVQRNDTSKNRGRRHNSS
ncbi:immunoglobulin epsilon heavy chain-like [Oncorhynchus nerka]|uniref:immunoglobulin epsilon heavy chain-like n=1 Tax=Oncorhynchus nerka TaxID=8023 RepID=UPI0031B8B183